MVMVTPVDVSALPLSAFHRLGAVSGPRGDTFCRWGFQAIPLITDVDALLPSSHARAITHAALKRLTRPRREPGESLRF
jgi:hypothetical protein